MTNEEYEKKLNDLFEEYMEKIKGLEPVVASVLDKCPYIDNQVIMAIVYPAYIPLIAEYQRKRHKIVYEKISQKSTDERQP